MSQKNDFTNDRANDPFDEFEFKPLTAGLGFHKKNEPKQTGSQATSKVEFKNNHLTFDQAPNATPSAFNLQSPLPRNTRNEQTETRTHNDGHRKSINVPMIEDDSITKAQSAVNEILKTLNQKKQQEDALARNSKKLTWRASAPSISAGFLDTLLITAFFLLSLILMLAITRVDLIANISQPDPQYLIYWATLSLLAGIQIIYYVSCRAFLGCTPGEWAFDQRCGNELQLASASYILKVTARSILNIATGFVVMTFISALLRFDILAALTGVQIQRQKLV